MGYPTTVLAELRPSERAARVSDGEASVTGIGGTETHR